jgi:hypothetical protein
MTIMTTYVWSEKKSKKYENFFHFIRNPQWRLSIFAVSKQMRKFARQLKKFFSLVRRKNEGRKTKDERRAVRKASQ